MIDVNPTPAMLIGDSFRGGSETLPGINPATGDEFARVPRGTRADVDDAVAAAQAAQRSWAQRDPQERAQLLITLAEAVQAHGDELAVLDVMDNGSPIAQMRRDVDIATSQLRYFAGLVLEAKGVTVPSTYDHFMYSLREPYGVVARIGAFNHPLMFTVGKMAAPLVAGNAVISKPSEHTSLSSLRFAEIAAEVLPPGVVNIVTGLGNEVGDAIATHPEIRRLAFIGSAPTGRLIQRRAAEHAVKTVTLELGGKNPIVVLPDADLDLAVDGVIQGMNFTWQGQSCGSTSRLIVHSSIHSEFVDRLVARVENIRVGLPLDPETEMGAMTTREQLDKVLHYVSVGRTEGSTLRTGGDRITEGELSDGFFVRPALFDRVLPGTRLEQEEVFGPVLSTIPFESFEDAVRIANGVQYGLTASVFTRDLGLAHRFVREVEAGYVWVNTSSRHFPGLGYGGYKESGVGREEDLSELLSWTQTKSVAMKIPQD